MSFTVTVADLVEVADFTVTGLSNVTVNENVAWASATPATTGDDPIGAVDVDARGGRRGGLRHRCRDYEDPQDADADNVYAVTVRATDADGNDAEVSFTVTVADLVEVADFTVTGLSNVTVNENVAWASATPATTGDDPIGAVTWTLEGDDAGDFRHRCHDGRGVDGGARLRGPAGRRRQQRLRGDGARDRCGRERPTEVSFTVTVADTTESATLTVGGLSDATVNENVAWTSATPTLTGTPVGTVTWTLEGRRRRGLRASLPRPAWCRWRRAITRIRRTPTPTTSTR